MSDIEGYIIDKLEEQGIDIDKYTVVADKSGVEVSTGWLLKKAIASGKVTEVVVKKGKQIVEVGSTVNYMPEGVGDTNYTGGWKVLGVDEEARLLIMSSTSITGSTITLGGSTLAAATQSYLDALTTLQNAVSSYKDGTIGIAVRSVKVEDIDALTSFDKTTYNAGKMDAYGNEVTYTWDGTDKPAYSYGTPATTGNLSSSHSSSGFTYYDVASGKIVTLAYTTTAGTAITTLKSNYYYYAGSKYLADKTKAYKMIFRNAADSGNEDTYWLASRCTYAGSGSATFGVRRVYSGGVDYNSLFRSRGYSGSPSCAVRAVVTLAFGAQLTESTTTAGTYDVAIAK